MKLTRDQWASLFFLALGAYGFIFSFQLSFGELADPGPAMFPFGLSILLLVSGILWFIQGKGTTEEQMELNWRTFRAESQAIKIIACTAGFVFALERLGYLLSAFIFLFILYVFVSRFKIRTAIALSIGVGIGTWLFFGKMLSVQFPMGLLPF